MALQEKVCSVPTQRLGLLHSSNGFEDSPLSKCLSLARFKQWRKAASGRGGSWFGVGAGPRTGGDERLTCEGRGLLEVKMKGCGRLADLWKGKCPCSGVGSAKPI